MNFKRTLIAVLILALIVGFYLIDSARKEHNKETAADSDNLAGIESSEISDIRISKKGQDILFVKNDEKTEWFIDDAFEGRIKTDKANIAALLENLGSIRKTESLGEIKDYDKYGLTDPRLTIHTSDGNNRETLHLGKTTPAEDGVYFMKKGDKNLYVADSAILAAANKSLYEFRNKRLLDIDPEKISFFSFIKSGKTFTFEKINEDWMLVLDKKYRADEDIVKRVLNSLVGADVKEFLRPADSGDKVRGFDAPVVQISLKESSGRMFALSFGKVKTAAVQTKGKGKDNVPPIQPEPERIYSRSSIYKSDLLVENSLIADFKTDPNAWKSKKILDIHFDSINDTGIIGPEKTVAFKRSGKNDSEFEIYEPEKMRASHWECNSLNSRIANMQAMKFLQSTPETLRKAGFSKPYATINFKTGKNKLNPEEKEAKEYSIIIGAVEKADKTGERYVKIKGNDKEIFLVSSEVIKDVLKTPFDLREKELVHVNAEEVEEITINTTINKKPVEITIEKDDDKWEVSDPRDLRDKNVDDILWDIMSLKMDGTAVKPEKLSDYGLEKPVAVIKLHLEDDTVTVIKIGSLIPGDNPTQNYIIIEGDDNIYITSTALRNVISGLIAK